MSSKSGDKRTYVWAKAERTCVLLAIGVFVNVIKVQRQKDIYMDKSQKDMCPFSYGRAREENSECTGKFHQSPETKKKVIRRSVQTDKNEELHFAS